MSSAKNTLRSRAMARLRSSEVETLIVGAGINGAVTASALGAAGVSTALIDRGDFAGFTSQESSNLIWGGFKYLQSYEFTLVRKLSMARNRLTDAFPSQVEPIEFLATFDEHSPFPTWLAGAGAAMYWAMGNFKTERPRLLDSDEIEELEPIIDTSNASGGLIYSDAFLHDNDARFVFGFVLDAIDQGVAAANYVELLDARFDGNRWQLELHDRVEDETFSSSCETIVNATGPFVDKLNDLFEVETEHRIALSKGVHLVVPRIGSGERVFAFFDEDDRLYYVIPMKHRSVIGTTDTRVDSPFTQVDDDDREFVLRQINARLDLEEPLTPNDIIGERSGVRPLVVKSDGSSDTTDWLQLSRRHEIEYDEERSVVTIFGGKLTDCVNVGEEIVDLLYAHGRCPARLAGDDWFGEASPALRDEFLARRSEPSVDLELLWRRYGPRAHKIVDRIDADPTTAKAVWDEPPFVRAELFDMAEHEMVVTLDDFLRRRSSLALTSGAEALSEASEAFGELLRLDPGVSERLGGRPRP